jgi:ribose transport system substrate-binding protein
MRLKQTLAAIGLAALGTVSLHAAQAQEAADDPGPSAYASALKDKRVVLVPMAMGFDLAQGWNAFLKREVSSWGGVYDSRDPNWVTDAGTQALTDLVNSEPKPNVLVVHSPDLNSYKKVLQKAHKEGIYVVLVDNPMNFPADAYVGSDWDRLGQLEAEAAVKGCEKSAKKEIGLVQGDAANATSILQYNGIMKVLKQHSDVKVVAEPFSNWDQTQSRTVTATMLQQHPDLCAIIDFWDGDAVGAAAAIKEAGKKDQVFLVTTGGGATSACKALEDGTYGAMVMTDLVGESRDLNAVIKYLLQSGQKPGTSKTYIYTLEKATTKADLRPGLCWNVEDLQAGKF